MEAILFAHKTGLPLPLDTEGSGVDAQKLAEIVALQRRAVDEQDYRVAAELTDLLRVLQQPGGHSASLSSDDFAFETLEAQERCFLWHGFVILRGTFSGEHLRRLQDAWRRTQRRMPRSKTLRYVMFFVRFTNS